MINQIRSNVPTAYVREAARVEGRKPAAVEPGRGVKGPTDEVAFSQEAQALQRLHEAVKESPDVRVDVVEQLRAQIEAGTYQVDADSLAENLNGLLG